MNRTIFKVSMAMAMVVLLSSCASVTSVSKKFTPQTKANIGIFADQTISMLKDADVGFSRNETLYTREFYDMQGQEEKDVRAYRQEADDFFIRIIKYSLDLVLIAETKETAQERVAAYADRVTNMNQEVLEKLEVSPDRYDEIKKQVASSEEFLDALRLGQPIINATGRHLHQILDNFDVAIDVLSDKIDAKIDERYAEVIHYQVALENEKYNILRSLSYLYGAYKGNMEAYAKLSSSETIHRKDLIPDPPPTDEDLSKIAEYLRNRLTALHVVENETKSDWERYRATHLELDTLVDKARRQSTRSRMILLVWLRAHQKMASGIVNPAEWYDIKSLPSQLINLGVGSASAVF